MHKLANGNIVVNGTEYTPDTPSNLYKAICHCGWTTVDNDFTAYVDFQEHPCLTKAGKPRKKPRNGVMRQATMQELWESSNPTNPTRMVSWKAAMEFANAVATTNGWDDDTED